VALQAAEKAEKAYFFALGMEAPFQRGKDGHDLIKLSDAWPSSVRAAIPELAEALARLNQHAENTRYPHPGVSKARAPYLAPHEDYEPGDSKQALEDARAVVDVCVNLAAEAKRFADGLGLVLGAPA
jgi:HEPN domain-containing protein